ncbi:ATP-binding protein [Vibrio sp. SCSIO 43137]|uniref:ATP-binding protein n=1 Tax=Vibrio sp. SCSIO 43137 TaxID=3021011 RepID=UPI0023078CC9|nr:ATP-binding protein [Vibrio sp. SCSIO 43137]WCE29550.1 ATP-binding protein [Vibrio sp. SCSIO 43137]
MGKDREIVIAQVCHDLRAPLARIRLAAELLSDSERQLAKGIVQDTEDCHLIINQLTEFARSADKSLPVCVSINPLIRDVVSLFQGSEPGQIETDLDEHIVAVFVDPIAIRRALSNLITNAFRYGKGWIKLSTGISRKRDSIWFCVEDNGPGIQASQVERLMQPFQRGEEATSGTGLGLAIVCRVAKQHSGSFSVCNRAEGGLKARLTIPYTKANDA